MASNNWARYVAGALILFVLAYMVYRFSTIVSYILAAWVLSLIGQPIAFALRRVTFGSCRRCVVRKLCSGSSFACSGKDSR
ncbi:MAG: hypothetical protein ACKOYP_13030 [Bacteroidota bacterium]